MLIGPRKVSGKKEMIFYGNLIIFYSNKEKNYGMDSQIKMTVFIGH